MIAPFLSASGDFPGRWERAEPEPPRDPWAVWLLRVFTALVVGFWVTVAVLAWGMRA